MRIFLRIVLFLLGISLTALGAMGLTIVFAPRRVAVHFIKMALDYAGEDEELVAEFHRTVADVEACLTADEEWCPELEDELMRALADGIEDSLREYKFPGTVGDHIDIRAIARLSADILRNGLNYTDEHVQMCLVPQGA